jgi:hypothetical protein
MLRENTEHQNTFSLNFDTSLVLIIEPLQFGGFPSIAHRFYQEHGHVDSAKRIDILHV